MQTSPGATTPERVRSAPLRFLAAALAAALLPGCGGGGRGSDAAPDEERRAAPSHDLVHLTAADNVFLGVTVLDHPALNGRPDALPLVTPAYSLPDGRPTGVANLSPVALRYTPGSGRWALVNQRAGVAMPVGQVYHVSVYEAGGEGRALRFRAPDDPAQALGVPVPAGLVAPDEVLLVTPSWWDGAAERARRCDALLTTPAVQDGTYVVSRAGRPIEAGQVFHGAALRLGSNVIMHVASVASLRGPESEVSHPLLDGRPDAVVQVAAQWYDPDRADPEPRSVGVRFDAASGRWRLRTDSGAALRFGSLLLLHVRR